MLYPDLSVPQTPADSHKTFAPKPAVASVADRFLSFLLDFLIFSPIVGVLIAGFLRQAKTSFLIYSSVEEALVFSGLIALIAVSSAVFLQATFLFYFQATPGQLFTKLKVIAYPARQAQLSFNQCVLRSIFWWCGGVVFFLPFLEILSHPLRRGFHERASDTMVVTQKKNFDEGPHAIETKFFASWMRMSFLLLLGAVALGAAKTYKSLVTGDFRSSVKSAMVSSVCSKNAELAGYKGFEALDLSLTLYLADAITGPCLLEKADKALWSSASSEEEEFAYLAKYLASTAEDKQAKYFKLVCENAKSDSCHLAKYMSEGGKPENLGKVAAKLKVSRFLAADELFLKKDYTNSLKILKDLQKVGVLESALEKRFIRSIWALNDEIKNSSGRAPASSSQELLEDFKEKYELP